MAALVISSIQRGSTNIVAGNVSANQSITAVTLANTVLRVNGIRKTGGGGASEPRYGCVSGHLSSTTNILFEIGNAGAALTVEWEVISYTSGINVQRGTAPATWGGGTTNVTITAVTLARSFPIVNSSGDPGGSVTPQAQTYLTSTTNLRYVNADSVFSNAFSWQVADIDDATVAAGQGALGTGTNTDITISAVTMNKTFLECTWSNTGAASSSDGDNNLIFTLTSSTNVRFSRQAASGAPAANYAYNVISIGGSSNFNVQRGTVNIGGATSATAALTSVNTSKTQLHLAITDCCMPSCNNATSYELDDFTSGVITSSVLLTFTKGSATNRAQTVSWETLEEKAPGSLIQLLCSTEFSS
jgi:hypothetical protein